ncbi:PEP-CTERM sorting domain-containing protein [Methylophilus methylotrophus]|uniref:PEP-CTERM sorting domain-containing protein n=1 Tax=Methylophilus methylotrophus TaxID=17 RepID=UPI000F5963A4|nr:PEP-CTERM sorting domain-containing protein [Methylophilus methylotrophus]
MNTSNWKQSFAVAAFAVATSTSAYAGGFVEILNNGVRTPGSVNDLQEDPFYISGGIPSTWSLLNTATSAVYSPTNGNEVGSFIDSVWFESSTNSYIIGSYFKLLNDTNGITEINSIVRTGYSEVDTLSAAWTSASVVYGQGNATGYRLRDPARSDYRAPYVAGDANAGLYQDLDKVAFRTDVSTGEGNPNSGLYLLKFSAEGLTYQWTNNAVHIVQGASSSENGRIRQDMWLSGFAVTAVPEAETYAMMMAGLGLIGTIARRRKSA